MNNLFKLVLNLPVLVIFLTGFSLKEQVSWDVATLKRANTAINESYFTKEEKEIIFYSNLARINGPLFAETFLNEFVSKNNMKSNKWINSLQKDLKKSPAMEPLKPNDFLHKLALEHSKTMGRKGKTGHLSFEKRTKEAVKKFSRIGENCEYGSSDGFSIVMNLLIDENVPNLGHRKNILNSDYKMAGVSIQPHKKYGVNSVMIFGGELRGANYSSR